MNLTPAQVKLLQKASRALESTRDFVTSPSGCHYDECAVSRTGKPCDCYASLVPDAADGLAKLLRQIAGAP
mgnify:CR=1 FL=1